MGRPFTLPSPMSTCMQQLSPICSVALRLGPYRHRAKRSVWQDLICPPLVIKAERTAQFHGVDTKAIENVVVADRQLLRRSVDIDGPRLQAERSPTVWAGHRHESRETMAGKTQWNPIRTFQRRILRDRTLVQN
jgi:hypothetical protein